MELGQGLSGPKRDNFMIESHSSNETSLLARFPYASRLSTNYAPSDEEVREIKAFLHGPTEQLQQMEAEIQHIATIGLQLEIGTHTWTSFLQAKHQLLKQRHYMLKKQVEACRSLITMTRRLPDDVLLYIFYNCLPVGENPAMGTAYAPMLLTTVCRRWRMLAIHTPKLWSAIHLGYIACTMTPDGRTDVIQKNLYTHILPRWLARSGTYPLSFSLVVATSQDEQTRAKTQAAVNDCFKALIPLVFRWKSVMIESNNVFLSPLWQIPGHAFQALESLFLHVDDYSFPAVIPMFSAPNLRKVSIQQHYLDPIKLHLPWSRLTHLDLGGALRSAGIRIATLSMALGFCRSLVYLGFDFDAGLQVKPMHLPNLRHLSLRRHFRASPVNICSVFSENLRAPLLRRISLRSFDHESFVSLLSNLGRSVESLELTSGFMETGALLDGLRYCPSLLSLSVVLCPQGGLEPLRINEQFFAFFTAGNNGNDTNTPCPLLQELVIDRLPCEALTGLIAFLKKKNGDLRVLSPLKRLSVDFVFEDGKIIHESVVKYVLKPFVEDGLVFEMWNGRKPSEFYGNLLERIVYGYGYRFQHADCWRN